MKKILIAGKDSYIGDSLMKWLSNWKDDYKVDCVSTLDDDWQKYDFQDYDTLVFLAAIVHIKESTINKAEYFKVNCELAIDFAKRAKQSSIKQFIFLSTMNVYGIDEGIIDQYTIPAPKTLYGKSKLEAEKGLLFLQDNNFAVAILRPPMVYGKNCSGNYPRLSRLARKLIFIPQINNQRSMIYISNLCEFIRLIIEKNDQGIFHPQNEEYVNTTDLIQQIILRYTSKVRMIVDCGFFIRLLMKISKNAGKVFGDLMYEKKLSEYKRKYQVTSFRQSIFESENFEDS